MVSSVCTSFEIRMYILKQQFKISNFNSNNNNFNNRRIDATVCKLAQTTPAKEELKQTAYIQKILNKSTDRCALINDNEKQW